MKLIKMNNKYILLLLFVLSGIATLPLQAEEPQKLSKSAYASILTCGPGNEYYDSFGHTAIRVKDEENGIDVVFNYGSFDFDVPHFYLRFSRGMLDYFVLPYSYPEFMIEYELGGRAVWEQHLLLDSTELQTLFDALVENVQPENMYYKYDFFRDNCATRVRDILEQSIDKNKCIPDIIPSKDVSYRDLLYKYTEKRLLWWRLGIDLLLGSNCDRTLTSKQYMYIPMEMMTQYDTAVLADGSKPTDGIKLILKECRPLPKNSFPPTLCFWFLFAIVVILTIMELKKGWRLYWLDAILYGAAGLLSLLILFLWFGSDHWCSKYNLNIIWANPLLLWLLIRLRKKNTVVRIIMIALLAVFLAGWAWWPQHFNAAVIPITLTLIMRLTARIFTKNENDNSNSEKKQK